MPVRFGEWYFEDIMGLQESTCMSYPSTNSDVQLEAPTINGTSAEYYTSSPVPNEDIWKKFEILDGPMSDIVTSAASTTDDDCELDLIHEDFANCSTLSLWAALDTNRCLAKRAREIRQHDCMWAGHCISIEHKHSLKSVNRTHIIKRPVCTKKDSESEVLTTTREASTKNVRSNGNVAGQSNTSVVLGNNKVKDVRITQTGSRSLLLTSRANSPSNSTSNGTTGANQSTLNTVPDHSNAKKLLNSGKNFGASDKLTHRPLTPQSLNESDEDEYHPTFQHSIDISATVASTCAFSFINSSTPSRNSKVEPHSCGDNFEDCNSDDELNLIALPVSEVTGQVARTAVLSVSQNKVGARIPTYYSDHSYHLNKDKIDNLGVQTPSDSEEEIDVVSVGEKIPAGRNTMLPTNPSAQDQQQIQWTVASAINKQQVPASDNIQPQVSLKLKICAKTFSSRTVSSVANSKKRPTTVDNVSSRIGRAGCKNLKQVAYQYQPRIQYQKCTTSRSSKKRARSNTPNSDSECDEREKRSLHNDMERKRRVDMSNQVENLRILVPEVKNRPRAPKVDVLNEAALYCKELVILDNKFVSRVEKLRKKQVQLQSQISLLRRTSAAKRMQDSRMFS